MEVVNDGHRFPALAPARLPTTRLRLTDAGANDSTVCRACRDLVSTGPIITVRIVYLQDGMALCTPFRVSLIQEVKSKCADARSGYIGHSASQLSR